VSAVIARQQRALRRLVQECLLFQFEPRRSRCAECNGLLTLRTLAAGARGVPCPFLRPLHSRAASFSAVGSHLRADKHHSFALVGRQEDDAICL
jgi:hypothetical protein